MSNKSDKACFQHEMAYVGFKDLNRRKFVDKRLRHQVFDIAKDAKYDGYQRGLPWMVNSDKYQTKVSTEGINQYLNFLIDPGFQGINRLFDL